MKYTLKTLEEFYLQEGRLPSVNKEKGLYLWMNRQINDGSQEIIEFCEGKIGIRRSRYTFQDLKNFYLQEGRLPSTREPCLYGWMRAQIKKGSKEIIEFCEGKMETIRYTFQDLKDFYIKEGRLPSRIKEQGLYLWMNRHLREGSREVINFCGGKIGIRHSKYTFRDLKDFYLQEGRLPSKTKEPGLYLWMRRQINSGSQEIINFIDLVRSIEFDIKRG